MMNTPQRTMSELFGQLGLPAEDADITHFIRRHRPLGDHLRLAEAPFWSDSQACFLSDKLKEDSDWSHLIDSLSNQLRAAKPARAAGGARTR